MMKVIISNDFFYFQLNLKQYLNTSEITIKKFDINILKRVLRIGAAHKKITNLNALRKVIAKFILFLKINK